MLKTKYYVIAVIILILAIYRILLSFDIFSYFLSGQDMIMILILLISLTILFNSSSLEKISFRVSNIYDNISLKVENEGIDRISFAEQRVDEGLLKSLLGIQSYLKKAIDFKELMSKFLVASSKFTRSHRASIMLFDEKKEDLYIYKTLGWRESEIRLSKNTRIKPGEGIAGRVFIDEKSMIMAGSDRREDFEFRNKYKSESFISSPIFLSNRVIGVLNLTEKEDDKYSQQELDILQFLINEVSIFLMDIRH